MTINSVSYTHLDVYKRQPFPLLIMPAANLSYILQRETFNLINNMEFLNDRYASMDVSWDLNGKIFNRIPSLKKLKWREAIGCKMLYGHLTDKNNPMKHPGAVSYTHLRKRGCDAELSPCHARGQSGIGRHSLADYI